MNATLISIFVHREVAPIERTTGESRPGSHSGPSCIRPGVASGRGAPTTGTRGTGQRPSVTRVGTKANVDPVLCTAYLVCHVHSGSARSKSMVNSGACAKARTSWLIMRGEPPQAGNGAGKSPRRR